LKGEGERKGGRGRGEKMRHGKTKGNAVTRAVRSHGIGDVGPDGRHLCVSNFVPSTVVVTSH